MQLQFTISRRTDARVTGTEVLEPRRCGKGFTLIELLIILLILGVLAAMVIPTYSSAAASARQSNLVDNLRNIRTQLLVYAAQHDGVAPGYPNGDTGVSPTQDAFVVQLTGYTDARGYASSVPDDACHLGPYLLKIPANPFNDNADVRVIGPGAFPAAASGGEGWIYQPSTLTFAANVAGVDQDGRNYFDY